jgi:mono/diheme cytochrome c family protein
MPRVAAARRSSLCSQLVACGLGIGSLLALAGTALAQTPGGPDTAAGYDIAARVCSACHLIEPRHAGPVVDGVPTLMRIADTRDDEEIETLLLAPSHPEMPAAPLTRLETSELIAYIRSLATE